MPSRAVPVLVLGGFSLLTLAVFRPTLSEVAHTAPAFHGFVADALLLMWATSHVSRAFFADPLHLFEAGIYHPARHTLAFGDHMIGQALVGLPVWLATKNPVLEYNVLALASYALGATAMFLYDLAPGQASSPYHYEYEEEWLLVVEGTVVVRAPDREHILERGDLVCFPSGTAGAHKVMN